MRRATLPWLAAWIMLGAAAPAQAAVPKIDRPIIDLADALSEDERNQIADRLIALRVDSGVQMAVLIVPTTDGQPIEDYSIAVAEAWRGGSDQRSDGVLLVIALNDRRMRFEVGYDLEDRMTDVMARRILEGMKGELRQQDYAAAVVVAIEDVGRVVSGLEPVSPYTPEAAGGADMSCDDVGGFLIFVAFVVLVFVVIPIWQRHGGGWSGGSSGGWHSGRRSSSWGSSWGSSSSSSSSWSSSSSSWGGGGGSFGGGGASSSW